MDTVQDKDEGQNRTDDEGSGLDTERVLTQWMFPLTLAAAEEGARLVEGSKTRQAFLVGDALLKEVPRLVDTFEVGTKPPRSEAQRAVVRALTERPHMTARELQTVTGCSQQQISSFCHEDIIQTGARVTLVSVAAYLNRHGHFYSEGHLGLFRSVAETYPPHQRHLDLPLDVYRVFRGRGGYASLVRFVEQQTALGQAPTGAAARRHLGIASRERPMPVIDVDALINDPDARAKVEQALLKNDDARRELLDRALADEKVAAEVHDRLDEMSLPLPKPLPAPPAPLPDGPPGGSYGTMTPTKKPGFWTTLVDMTAKLSGTIAAIARALKAADLSQHTKGRETAVSDLRHVAERATFLADLLETGGSLTDDDVEKLLAG